MAVAFLPVSRPKFSPMSITQAVRTNHHTDATWDITFTVGHEHPTGTAALDVYVAAVCSRVHTEARDIVTARGRASRNNTIYEFTATGVKRVADDSSMAEWYVINMAPVSETHAVDVVWRD